MKILDSIEVKGFFTIIRGIYFLLALAISAILLFAIFQLYQTAQEKGVNVIVSQSDVFDAIKTDQEHPNAWTNSAGETIHRSPLEIAGYKASGELEWFLRAENNQEAFIEWLNTLPEQDRQPSITELDASLANVKHGMKGEELLPIVKKYIDIKSERIAARAKQLQKKREDIQQYGIGAAVAISLLTLSTLVLVLLAIERNTRSITTKTV